MTLSSDFRKPTQSKLQKQLDQRIKLRNPYTRLVCADVDGNGRDELIFLSQGQLESYNLVKGKLEARSKHNFYQEIVPLHLHAGDFNHNGKDEIYLTAIREIFEDDDVRTSELCSMVFEVKGKHFVKLGGEYPYYFRVLEERKGRQVLLAQKMGQYKQYAQPIWHMAYKNGELKTVGNYKQAKNIFSLYQFVLNPFNDRQVIILDEYGGMAGFDAVSEDVEITCETHFGVYDETSYQQRLPENDIVYIAGHRDKIDNIKRWSSRRFLYTSDYGQQAFLIEKERLVNPENFDKLKDKIIELKMSDKIVALQWKGGDITETWRSPELSRDIIDFSFYHEGGSDTLIFLTRNDQGKYFLETIR